MAALVDAERSWVGPGLQLYLADVSDDASWRQTFRIGPCDGFLRAEAERHPAGMWGGAVTIWVRPKRRRAGVAVNALRELVAADLGLGCLEALVDQNNSAALACFAVGSDQSGMVILRRSLRTR